VLVARDHPGATAAALLGIATGIAHAGTATHLLLNQLAFQAGPLAASLPAMTVVNPLLAVLLGVVVYDENLRHTPWAITPLPGHPHAHQR
jgi:hypothetical protein